MLTEKMKLIVEANDFGIREVKRIISPNKEDMSTKDYFIEGIFIQSETKNRNGRNYPKPLMEACVQKYINERMKPGFVRSFGELGHPDGVEINLDKMSHYITELNWNGNDVIGKAKILKKQPCGRIVETILEEGLTIGVSTRGLGSLGKQPNPDGSKPVTSYEMIAIDIVADPSAPKGFVDGILENKEYIIGKENGLITECYDGLERTLSTLPRHSDAKEKLFLNALEKFMSELKTK